MKFEAITEELLNEKLITYGNRAAYGQVVFIAGGSASGKGFAISNFLDSSSFKIRDVDEMKKQIQRLNSLGKLTIDSIIKKFGKYINANDLEIIRSIEKDGYKLSDMDLRNPTHVYALHKLVWAMGIKDKSLETMLNAQSNPETLPNIMFDITAKDITDLTSVIPMLISVGYKPQNIHLTWILTNYQVAVSNNKNRSRIVRDDIVLKTHEGASNTVWGIVTKALPRGMDGRVDVVLNNRENTIFWENPNSGEKITVRGGAPNQFVIKGFLSLPIKKAGGNIFPESLWKDKLYRWILDNAPSSITANMKESRNIKLTKLLRNV